MNDIKQAFRWGIGLFGAYMLGKIFLIVLAILFTSVPAGLLI